MTDSSPSHTATPESASKIKAWDIPTRVFHWALAVAVGGLFLTGEIGGLDFTMPVTGRFIANMELHTWFGFTVIGLLVFRIIWGVIGASTARFTDFVKGPGTVIQYGVGLAKRTAKEPLGHNPLGGLAVLAFILLLGTQAVTGLFTEDDSFFGISGPLADSVSDATSKQMKGIHTSLYEVILIFIGLHIAAVFAHWLIMKDNLIKAMITGYKDRSKIDAATPMAPASFLRFITAAAIGAATVWLVLSA